MVVMASHTGARRSEICRSRSEDIDFESDMLLIREKKRTGDCLPAGPLDGIAIECFRKESSGTSVVGAIANLI